VFFNLDDVKYLLKALCAVLSPQHDFCGGTRVLTRIMMLEAQTEVLLQRSKTMPAVAFQFWPSGSRDSDTVLPVPVGLCSTNRGTGCADSAAIEARMLIDWNAFQPLFQQREHFFDTCSSLDHVGSNAVQPTEYPAVGIRVYQGNPALDPIIGANAGKPHLTDAPAIVVGGLNVQCKEAEGTLGEHRQRACCGLRGDGRTGLIASVEPPKLSAQRGTCDRAKPQLLDQ